MSFTNGYTITKVVDAGLIETITQMELMPIVNELMKEE